MRVAHGLLGRLRAAVLNALLPLLEVPTALCHVISKVVVGS